MSSRKIRIVVLAVVCCVFLIASASLIAYAVLQNQKDLSVNTQVGTVEVVSVENPSLDEKIKFTTGETISCPITINLSANVDAVLRVKIATRYFDNFERLISVPNNIQYDLNGSVNWTSDGFDLCFYYNASIKDMTSLTFINGIVCGEDPDGTYDNVYMDFVVEVDVLQMSAIDYANHPWEDNAPESWLDLIQKV